MAPTLPDHVDAGRLAAQGTTLEGGFPAAALNRLSSTFTNVQPAAVSIEFALNDARQVVLRGEVSGRVTAICQRCLQPVDLDLRGEFEYVPEAEEMLEAGPVPSAASANFDLLALVEDELLLACPMIPKHADPDCHPPPEDEGRAGSGRENPFDVLATLRQNIKDKPRRSDAASNPEE